MDLFTWFSIAAFLAYGINEVKSPFGEKPIGWLLIFLAICIAVIELVTK